MFGILIWKAEHLRLHGASTTLASLRIDDELRNPSVQADLPRASCWI